MKNLIFTSALSILFAITAQGQLNESFFERLGSGSSSSSGFFGIVNQNGTLSVKLADSLDTEVQWVQCDFAGNFQTFSANLPANIVSPNERIIQLFETGNNQYLVTNDSLSYAPRGIRIHKFENLTSNTGYFEYPTSFSWKNLQSYYRNGKIYVFFVNGVKEFKRLTIDPNSMALEEELILGSDPGFLEGSNRTFKSIHVHFQSSGDMTVYANSTTQLARINISSNVPTMELREMRLKKVIGIDTLNNRLICLKNYSGYDLQRYELNSNIPLNDIQVIDSLHLSSAVPSSLKDWNYVTDGTTEFLTNGSGAFMYLTISGNQITAKDSISVFIRVMNTAILSGKPIAFGAKTNYFPSTSSNSLFVTYGEINEIFDFKEYGGIYTFNDVKTRFGIGNQIIPPLNNSTNGDFIFSNMIFYLSQNLIGKQNGEIKGFQENMFDHNYKPGPYTQMNQYNQDIVHQYNENFYVDLSMLNHHVASVGNSNYSIPDGILYWPAHGDVSKGQAANLAPFMDLDSDGSYEPTQGEYPIFPGTHCLLNITHQHETDFNGEGSGLELHTYMYNFTCEDSINNVFFLKTEVYNRGNINYDSLAMGMAADFDLGGVFDDFVGTNVENGIIYSYNGDSYDDDYEGMEGFEDSLPTVGIIFLQGNKFASNSQDDQEGIGFNQTVNGMGFGDGIADNEFKGLEFSHFYSNFAGNPTLSDPSQSEQWFNVLTGKHNFGDTIFYGNTNIPAKYYFPGDSDPLFYGTHGIDPGFSWSETNVDGSQGSNPPGDRRINGSFGSGPLAPGNKITYHSAVLTGKRIPGMGQSQLDLFAKANHVRRAFDENLTSCGQTFGNTTEDQVTSLPENKNELEIKIYPNPFSDEIYVRVSKLDEQTNLYIFDINGKLILTQKMTSNNQLVNTSALENGIYILKMENGSGNTSAKIIKK